MNKSEKANIDRLVNIFISGVLSVTNDAGWEGESMLSRLITYKGDIPPPSGNDQSNLTMMNAIKLLRSTHPDFPKIETAIYQINPSWAMAIVAKNKLRGLMPETEKTWTGKTKAEYINQSYSLYQFNLGRAYQGLNEIISTIESYEKSRGYNLCEMA